jgi:Dolichyl-phosphate-mannose-protein mannosyltransferase
LDQIARHGGSEDSVKPGQTAVHVNANAAIGRGLPYPAVVLLVAFLLGLFLRCFDVLNHELQYDEAATGYFSTLPWSDLWGGPAVLEPNPPLFYSVAWLVTHAGGTIEQLRLISVAAGSLCIPLVWLIARDLADDFAAAGAALLVATSPQHIAISQYARAYALLSLCLVGAFFCLLRARHCAFAQPQRGRRRKIGWWWSAYAIFAAAALYTHHTAIIVLAALNAAVLLILVPTDGTGRFFVKKWLVANLFVAGFYASWLPVIVKQVQPATVASSAKIDHVAFLQGLWGTVSPPSQFSGVPWIDVRLLPVILFGLWRQRLSRAVAFLAAFVVCGLVLMRLASAFRPLLDGKTLAWAGLFAMTAAAIGCSAAGRFRLPLLIVMVLLGLRSDLTVLYPVPEGWREVAAILGANALPGDALYINYAASVLPLRHYGWSSAAGMTIKIFAKANEEPWFRGHTWPVVDPRAAIGATLQDNQEGERVWLLTYGASHSDDIANAIAAKSVRALHRQTEKLDLSLFLPTHK